MANAPIDLARLREEDGIWVDDRPVDPSVRWFMNTGEFEILLTLKFYPFARERFGDPFFATLRLMQLSDGQIVASIGYSIGQTRLLFTQEEVDQILPFLIKEYPVIGMADMICGNYIHKFDGRKEHRQRIYEMPALA